MIKDKKYLRSFYNDKIKALQKNSGFKNQEADIVKNLSSLNLWDSQWTIAAYQALEDEVSLKVFYETHSKNKFVFPLICGKTLEFYQVEEEGSFQKNSFSLLEPNPKTSQKVSLKKIQAFLVPGRVFDRQGGRLGRGQAYYDKVLPQSSLKIGVALSEQIYEGELPLEEHDVLMDIVVTEKFVLIPKMIDFRSFGKRTA